VIYSHSSTKYCLCAHLSNIFYNLPNFYEVHSNVSSNLQNKVRQVQGSFLESITCKKATKTLIICEGLRRQILSHGVSPDKIEIIQNGVDLSLFRPIPKSEELVKKYSIENKKVVMFVGKFQKWENLGELVEVYSKVIKKVPDSVLFLVGDGPGMNEVKKSIHSNKLEQNVILTGFVDFKQVSKYYSLADVFVMVRPNTKSLNETTPIKPLEAMAMGKVVVSTDLNSMREFIDDGKTGFLVPHSREVIANKIVDVLTNPMLRERTGNNARKYVEENRDWRVIVKKLSSVFGS